ncbi:MAG: helix-turn-helix transcriptional regulator [Rhodospirillaceae bacterium]|nr:helix-turn-helix transcriptional regulator [Rhodospirillaceae bacterium]
MAVIAMKSRGRGRQPSARGGGPDPVDIHVGKRIKLRRTLLHISQEQLAGDVGVTFQQVQKYESGHNRVSASRLYDISRVLSCPISYFFEDINEGTTGERKTPSARAPEGLAEDADGFDHDPMQRTETLELVRAYWRLHNAELRRNVLELLNNISRRDV